MISVSEVVFSAFSIAVLCLALVFGYSLYANSWRTAEEIYEENANVTIQLLEFYPDSMAYFPVPFRGRVVVKGWEK